MLIHRKAEDRGRANFGWLDSRHTFSFGGLPRPRPHGLPPAARHQRRPRRARRRAFGTHPHRDMEIISYVLEGALEHQRQPRHRLGHPAGRRPAHVAPAPASATASSTRRKTEPVHFLQIWILPEQQRPRAGLRAEGVRATTTSADSLRLVGSRDGRDGSVTIHQDVDLYAHGSADGEHGQPRAASPAARPGCRWRAAPCELNGTQLHPGDGVGIEPPAPSR